MGYNDYSDDAAEAGVAARIAAGKPAVASYTADIAAGQRRPAAHQPRPEGLAVSGEPRQRETIPSRCRWCWSLDQTGSMGGVVRQIQKSLRSIAKLLVQKKYLPHILHIMR